MTSIESFKDLGLAISEYISQAVYNLVYCIIYPFQLAFYWISNILKLMWDSFINLMDSFYSTFDILYNFVSNSIISLFPSIWCTIILLGLTIVFTLRLYYFLKDISIVGNKI